MIDTGFRRDDCRQALTDALKSLESGRDRRDVLITHLHSDHCGLADEFAGDACNIFVGAKEFAYLKHCITGEIGRLQDERMVTSIDERFCPMVMGEKIKVGEYELTLVNASGHTPGNMMVWLENEKLMFTGDHVLFDISPNITAWPDVTDALGKLSAKS